MKRIAAVLAMAHVMVVALGVLSGCATGGFDADGVMYVGAEHLKAASCGLGLKAVAGKSVRGRPLTVAGKTYKRGVGTHPESAIGFRANGLVTAFDALVGIDDDFADFKQSKAQCQAKAEFRVWADGKVVKSVKVVEGSEPVGLHVDLEGAREIVLETCSFVPSWLAAEASDADWLEARFTGKPGARLEAFDDPGLIAQLGILTPPAKKEPQFNGAEVWGVRPGHPVIFRVPVSGERPMKFSAAGLPAGVTFDAKKGIIGGKAPPEKGDYPILVTAENAHGRAERAITLKVGDTICLTPPMGWNSWNIWGSRFTGAHAMAAAKALDESGLADYGWAYVNLDDFWEMNNSPRSAERPELRGPARDAEGNILPNPSFPDMKGMVDYIHSLGFKAGLYSSPGPTTCGGCEGSYRHEMQDAKRWADWGFDYVKYDWCSYDTVIADIRGGKRWRVGDWRDVRDEPKERPYRLMRDCLLAQDRDIVYSFCQYGIGRVWEWARDAGANCWRCWEDLKDLWPWMEMALEARNFGAENYWRYSGPGCWADPDMMLVGLQRSFGSTHPTYLTPNEQYTHVSLWAMVCSPLLIGTDLANLDPFTKSLLTNPMVIAISQDTLGSPARRIRHVDAESVWTRPLANGDIAVALVNRYPFAREIAVDFAELGISGEWYARDQWTHKCEGRQAVRYSARVPSHGTKLIRLREVACPRCD